MKTAARPLGAFSLAEVVLALGVVSIALVAILSCFSAGVTMSRQSMFETRCGQITGTILSTLRTPPFDKVDLFGKQLDLAQLSSSSAEQVVYVEYDEFGNESGATLPRFSTEPLANWIYMARLSFDNAPTDFDLSKVTPGTINKVSIVVTPRTDPSSAARYAAVIARYK